MLTNDEPGRNPMTEQTTTIGAPESVRNSLTLFGVDRVRSGTVAEDGRVYVGSDMSGTQVEYALIREGVITSIGTKHDGAVTLNDIEEYDHGKILSNGYLFVGTGYDDEEVTVAVRTVNEQESQQSDS